MNVLMINGSPRRGGNTSIALKNMAEVFAKNGIDTEILEIGGEDIRGCIACGKCGQTGKCVFDDSVNRAAEIFEHADGLVAASPVYYASPNGNIISFLDRLFYSTSFDKTMKVGAAVAVARRGVYRDVRRPQQVFHHQRNAGRLEPLLEHGPRNVEGRGRAGRRGHRDRQDARREHELFNPLNRSRQGEIRTSRKGEDDVH